MTVTAMPPPALILASGSPRRRELLAQIGVLHEVRAVDIDETPHAGEAPAAMVERLARAKAAAGHAGTGQGGKSDARVSLGADTTVVHAGRALGKPADVAAADAMLAELSATTHEVLSAVAVAAATGIASTVVRTRVTFRELTPAERAAYCASGEPMGKAGGYAIQGLGAVFVRHIEGSYSNVVGLPLFETARLLADAGIDPLSARTEAGTQSGIRTP